MTTGTEDLSFSLPRDVSPVADVGNYISDLSSNTFCDGLEQLSPVRISDICYRILNLARA